MCLLLQELTEVHTKVVSRMGLVSVRHRFAILTHIIFPQLEENMS